MGVGGGWWKSKSGVVAEQLLKEATRGLESQSLVEEGALSGLSVALAPSPDSAINNLLVVNCLNEQAQSASVLRLPCPPGASGEGRHSAAQPTT